MRMISFLSCRIPKKSRWGKMQRKTSFRSTHARSTISCRCNLRIINISQNSLKISNTKVSNAIFIIYFFRMTPMQNNTQSISKSQIQLSEEQSKYKKRNIPFQSPKKKPLFRHHTILVQSELLKPLSRQSNAPGFQSKNVSSKNCPYQSKTFHHSSIAR